VASSDDGGAAKAAGVLRIMHKLREEIMSWTSVWPKILRRLMPRLRCSFCGRSADHVERLVSGASAYICDTCITACAAVLERHGGFAGRPPGH